MTLLYPAILIPETGEKRYIRKVIRDRDGNILDATCNIYKPRTVLSTTIEELSKAFPKETFLMVP